MTMRKSDYSKNAELLDWEAYDYDTRDVHETGINDNRMRLPDRYDIVKFYKRNKRPSSYDEFGNPRYEKGQWVKKAEEDAFLSGLVDYMQGKVRFQRGKEYYAAFLEK